MLDLHDIHVHVCIQLYGSSYTPTRHVLGHLNLNYSGYIQPILFFVYDVLMFIYDVWGREILETSVISP